MCPPPGKPIRLAVVSDLHTMRDGIGEQPQYASRLQRAIEAVNREKPDLVLLPGDLTESGTTAQLRDFLARIKAFLPPVRFVPGNHDVGGKWTPGGDPEADSLTKAYEAVAGRSYYSEVVAGVRLVAVNASILGGSSEIASAQGEWLDKEAMGRRQAVGVLLIHYPLFLERPDEPGGDYWTVEPEPRARVLDFIRKAGIKVVVSGHLHRPIVLTRDGVTYAGALAVSFGLPPEGQPEGWTLITIQPDGAVMCEERIVDGPDRPWPALPA
jgi:3',5'-cyclic AMP phosphodiesterase CpdA